MNAVITKNRHSEFTVAVHMDQLYLLFVIREIKHSSFVCLNALVILLCQDYNLVELALTGTGRNEVTADNVLLHTLETVALAVDSSIIEDLGGLLERSSRHEA